MDKDLRRLVVVGLALLVFLFVGRAIIGSVADVDAAHSKARSLSAKLNSDYPKKPSRGDLTEARQMVDELNERLVEVVDRIDYQRPPEFDVPDGMSPDLAFLDALRREQRALVQEARFIGKAVPPDLGMPVPNPTGMEDVLAALRALHVVHLVVSAALDADVAEVESIKLEPSTRRRRQKAGLIRTSAVDFELRGSPASIHGTLTRLVGGDVYLALDDVRVEADDEDGQSVTCRMSVATVEINREMAELGE